eukprot:5404965-Alexandrium_andersonii.AAC.1
MLQDSVGLDACVAADIAEYLRARAQCLDRASDFDAAAFQELLRFTHTLQTVHDQLDPFFMYKACKDLRSHATVERYSERALGQLKYNV